MKKRYATLLVVFLLILAVCTYASWQNYRNGLPVVQTVEAASTSLHFIWELSGTLHYDKVAEYSISVPVTVVQWAVQAGDRVSTGQPLLQIDTQQLYLQWLQCKIDEEALDTQLRWSDSFTKELLELQLAELRETIVFMENLIEADGWVIADTDGIVLNLQHTKQVAAEMPLVTIGPDSEQKTICFPLTDAQTAYCEPETELTVTLFCNSKSMEVTMSVDKVIYSAENEGYLCMVSTDLAVDMMDGQKTTATLTGESVYYKHVIPTAAIIDNNNGNVTFYVLRQRETVIGTEYYTATWTGHIEEQNEGYAALSTEIFDPVVINASRDIYNQCAVLLAGV